MTDMGFTVDGSTAGSSVRFDPPDRNTRVSAPRISVFVVDDLFKVPFSQSRFTSVSTSR
jgi:hypothetical protein